MRTLLNVLGMLVFGCAALVGFAYLAELRSARPLVGTAPVEGDAPVVRLASGVRSATGAARYGMEHGRRSDAMHALDAAIRAAEVAREATQGATRTAIEAGLDHLASAKMAVEDGRPGSALRSLALAERALDPSDPAFARPGDGAGLAHLAQEPVDPGDWVGAALLDARGARIGEVVRVDRDRARVAVGTGRDVFGMFDVGGRSETIPNDELVYGSLGGWAGHAVAWLRAPSLAPGP